MLKSRYAVIPDEQRLALEEELIDPTAVGPTEVLVRSEASVVSAGTELAIYTALAPGVRTPGSWNAYPFRPGYGVVGRVEAVGSAVTHLHQGDRILCFGKHADLQVIDVSGSSPRKAAFQIHDELPAERAAMLRMALVALAGPLVTTLDVGDTVCVFGLGLVGNLAAQLYQIAGARVVGLDPLASRCQLAREVGIETVLHLPPEDQTSAVLDVTRGSGATVAVDAVGSSAVIMNCLKTCADYGQVILLGSPRAATEGNLTEAFRTIHNRWLTVRGALEWRLPPYPTTGVKHSIASSVEMLTEHVWRGSLDVAKLVTHCIRPTELPAAYAGLLQEPDTYVGVVVDWRISDS